MKRGDLVVAHYDEDRGIECIGLVLEVRRAEVRRQDNVVVQVLADWMVARRSFKSGK